MSSRFEKVPPPLRPEVAERAWSARESWRVFGIMAEFVEATERLNHITPAVSIFGSARARPDSPYYLLAEDIARRLSDAGFSVISGGGPGIMEAANKGAYFGRSLAVGLNNNWVPVVGSENSNTVSVAIDPASPTVFYRLSNQ